MSEFEPYDAIILEKGEFISGGVSGIVERLPNGNVVKSPWPDRKDTHEDARVESRVYKRLAERLDPGHIPFVKFLGFDEEECTITMEYMANGTLRTYLQANAAQITQHQRCLWIRAIAEGVKLLHAVNVIHCDLTPHNLLLDADLEVKIADFGCSSIDGSRSMAGTNSRFYPSRSFLRAPVTRDDDLFALGSCIYEVLTGVAPLHDVPSPAARHLVRLRQLPDLTGLEYADIVRDCWLRRAGSAGSVHSRISIDMHAKGFGR